MCPAGGDIPDPAKNDKFAHKLHFLGEMEKFFGRRKTHRKDPVVLVGDLNVAPLENDVWSHKQLLDVVSHTPVETRLLGEAQAAFDWTDSTRAFIPPEEKIYSWWSYRAADWEASDRGRRLDHVWLSPGLKGALKSQTIVKKMRGWQKASDHVPVIVEIERLRIGASALRHGPTAWNAQGRIQGHTDIPLSDEGLEKMRGLLPPPPFEQARAFVSPSRRARQTAEALGLRDAVWDPRLMEQNWGSWEGLSRDEILARDGEDAFQRAGAAPRLPAAGRRIHRRTA